MRMWCSGAVKRVALHPEGVDRNSLAWYALPIERVALHPEGVDRNQKPEMRERAKEAVALHPEGVDRNLQDEEMNVEYEGRPPPGGRG